MAGARIEREAGAFPIPGRAGCIRLPVAGLAALAVPNDVQPQAVRR